MLWLVVAAHWTSPQNLACLTADALQIDGQFLAEHLLDCLTNMDQPVQADACRAKLLRILQQLTASTDDDSWLSSLASVIEAGQLWNTKVSHAMQPSPPDENRGPTKLSSSRLFSLGKDFAWQRFTTAMLSKAKFQRC